MNYALLLTLFVGHFILLGTFIDLKTKGSKKAVKFSLKLALEIIASPTIGTEVLKTLDTLLQINTKQIIKKKIIYYILK